MSVSGECSGVGTYEVGETMRIGCSLDGGDFHLVTDGAPACGEDIEEFDTCDGSPQDVDCAQCRQLIAQIAVKEVVSPKNTANMIIQMTDEQKEDLLRGAMIPSSVRPLNVNKLRSMSNEEYKKYQYQMYRLQREQEKRDFLYGAKPSPLPATEDEGPYREWNDIRREHRYP